MNKDEYGEIINGNETYSVIADKLINGVIEFLDKEVGNNE